MIMSFVSSRVLEKISTMSLTVLTFEPKIPKSAIKGQRFKYDLMISYDIFLCFHIQNQIMWAYYLRLHSSKFV